jgi:hypothetical protein
MEVPSSALLLARMFGAPAVSRPNIYFPVVIIFCLLLVPMYLFHVK